MLCSYNLQVLLDKLRTSHSNRQEGCLFCQEEAEETKAKCEWRTLNTQYEDSERKKWILIWNNSLWNGSRHHLSLSLSMSWHLSDALPWMVFNIMVTVSWHITAFFVKCWPVFGSHCRNISTAYQLAVSQTAPWMLIGGEVVGTETFSAKGQRSTSVISRQYSVVGKNKATYSTITSYFSR